MNKSLVLLFICSTLVLAACAKNEAPSDDEQLTSNPASEPLQPLGASALTGVDIQREQTENSATEIRREYYDYEQRAAAEQAARDAELANSPDANTQDEAVAAALAAATPALNTANTSPKPAPAQPQAETLDNTDTTPAAQ